MVELAGPKPTVDELRKQLMQAEEEQRRAVLESAKEIKLEWRWSTHWSGQYNFYCVKELTKETKDRIRRWEDFNGVPFPNKPWGGIDVRDGMNYVLVNNLLFQVGGGTLILKGKDGADSFSHEPRELTDYEATQLRTGQVPDSLKRDMPK